MQIGFNLAASIARSRLAEIAESNADNPGTYSQNICIHDTQRLIHHFFDL